MSLTTLTTMTIIMIVRQNTEIQIDRINAIVIILHYCYNCASKKGSFEAKKGSSDISSDRY